MVLQGFTSEGFSTLEILVASTIALTTISASAMVVYSAQDLTTRASVKNEALQILQEELSLTTTFTDASFASSGFEQRGRFSITKEANALSRFITKLKIIVSWEERDRVQEESIELLLPVSGAVKTADTCTLFWSGTWTEPALINSWQLPNNAQISDIDVLGGFAFVTTNDSTLSLPDMYIYDLHNLFQPQLIASLNTGPGLSSIQVVRDKAYVANTSVTSQLQIIDLSNIQTPRLVSSLAIPNPGTDGIHGHSLYVVDDKVYLGTLKNQREEFYIIDVINVSSPVALGSFETDTQINTIIVDQGYAYLATPNQSQLRVLDVSSPSSISLVSSFSASGYQVQDGRSMDLFGRSVFLGRTVGGFNNPSNNEVFNLQLSDMGQLSQRFSVDLAASARSLSVRDNFVFVGTNDPAKEWQVWGLGSGGVLLPWSHLDLPSSVIAQDCEDQNFFVALEGSSQVVIIGSE
jgi:hypothetical protein